MELFIILTFRLSRPLQRRDDPRSSVTIVLPHSSET